MSTYATRQFSFRLSDALIDRLERCMTKIRESGLYVNRADVVRLLLQHALDDTHCDVHRLLKGSKSKEKEGGRSGSSKRR
jgi:Arc/MetJ-type ribon-helix-helix transcriptional regulator